MSKLISIISRKIDLYHDMLFLLTSYRVGEMAFQNLITRHLLVQNVTATPERQIIHVHAGHKTVSFPHSSENLLISVMKPIVSLMFQLDQSCKAKEYFYKAKSKYYADTPVH